LTFQEYEGVKPPLVGFAVKLTGDPAQIVAGRAVNVMLTGSKGLTTMVIALLVAGLFEMQDAIEEVSTQLTISPLIGG
jgi:hypothetical protein